MVSNNWNDRTKVKIGHSAVEMVEGMVKLPVFLEENKCV